MKIINNTLIFILNQIGLNRYVSKKALRQPNQNKPSPSTSSFNGQDVDPTFLFTVFGLRTAGGRERDKENRNLWNLL